MPSTGRKPWLAVALSLLCPGLGHVYCGRLARGLWLFVGAMVLAPDAILVALAPPSAWLFGVLAVTSVASLLLLAFAVIDAGRIARRLTVEFTPQEFQRPSIYAAFLVVGVLCPAAATAVLYRHVFESFRIASGSMEPTLRKGDLILVNKLRPDVAPLGRGAICVFETTDDGERPRNYAKRVVALPGDTVEIRAGRVVLNGAPLPLDPPDAGGDVRREHNGDRSYRVRVGTEPDASGDVPELRLGDGQYFLLGDHRGASRDSRTIGPVPRDAIQGTVEYVFGWNGVRALREDE